MITSIVLINVDRGTVNEVAQELADMVGVSEVFSVSGSYDLVTIVRVATNDELADFVTNHLVKIDGVEKNRHNAGL